ncbi:hypothetical protein FACHB389_03625 [Nostoc calcicola FACHB-389]|nr:hypothetical protein [Nostoc sp. EkiNYC01]OKH41787.1 hypothetical protein FACHB389_03625 [Nostoc calcicola FACHB-389]
MTKTPSIEEIKSVIFKLPVEELILLLTEIEEKLETIRMMQLAETGFQEWNDPEEDIYNFHKQG